MDAPQPPSSVFLSLNFISFSLSFQLQLPTHSADYLSPPHGPFGCILLPASRYICSSFFRSRNRSSTIISSCMSPSPPLVLMDVLAAHILFFPLLSLSWYYQEAFLRLPSWLVAPGLILLLSRPMPPTTTPSSLSTFYHPQRYSPPALKYLECSR